MLMVHAVSMSQMLDRYKRTRWTGSKSQKKKTGNQQRRSGRDKT